VRGFGRPSDYNNRILLLVNGHRYNDNVYDQAPIGLDFPIDLALVDRIEVIRGPGSALYGTSAFFAVINVIVRPGGGSAAPRRRSKSAATTPTGPARPMGTARRPVSTRCCRCRTTRPTVRSCSTSRSTTMRRPASG
jgi:outer membrane cobalamin receptor